MKVVYLLQKEINDLYVSFDGKDVYSSIEEKSANLLYLIVKNHAFIDGNKRIAATIFIYFLQMNDILYKEGQKVIDNNTLASITLLIAESNPKEKEVMIDLVMSFLKVQHLKTMSFLLIVLVFNKIFFKDFYFFIF